MIPQTVPSAFAAVSADIRDCEREMAKTERHLLQIVKDTRRAQGTRSIATASAAQFPFIIAAAAALAWATAAITSRRW
jgi:hypothetical protein